jgi:hypothetical protein
MYNILANRTDQAIAVLPLVRVVNQGPHRAYNLVRTSVTHVLHAVIAEQLSWSADTTAANVYYRHTNRLGGFSRLMFEVNTKKTYVKKIIHTTICYGIETVSFTIILFH